MFNLRPEQKIPLSGFLSVPAVFLAAAFLAPAAHATTTSYTGTGSTTFTVPANVTSIQVTLTGAAGGTGGSDDTNQGGSGGPAGQVTGTLAVTPGDTLTFARGGSGGNGTSSTSNGGGGAGGSNAGGRVASGRGGDAGGKGSSGGGGGGGGSAYISRSGVTLAEAGGAGGGGGSGNTTPNQAGLNGNTTASYNGLSYSGGAGTNRGAGNDGGGGGGGGSGKRGGAGGGLRTAGDTDSGGNGGSAGENDISGLTSASSSYVTVASGADASISITYTAVPSAPVVTSPSKTDTSVSLSWSAPSSGPAITDYLVQYRQTGVSSWSTFPDGTSTGTTVTVTGLNHNTSYDFQVAAVNADGTGAYSSPITVTTKKNFVLALSAGSSAFTLLGSPVTVDSSLTITDETSGSISAAKVQISSGFQAGDTLALPTGGAAAAFPGITGSYNSANGILTLSGSGTAVVFQAALRAVTFTTTNTSTAARSVDVTLGSAIAYNGHFYEVVNSSVTWPAARSGALAKSLFGIPGYLANVTSLAENNFVVQAFAQDAWIGGSDSAADGTWKWMDGPEAGTTFWNGSSSGSAPAGQFFNWGTNEPNGGTGENYLAFNGASGGKWNDFGGSGPYIVEYGNPSAVISFSGTKTLSINQAPQTITFNPMTESRTFGDAPFVLTNAIASSGLPVDFISSHTNVATVSGNTVTIVGAGQSTITANQSGNATYAAASPVSRELYVAQAAQTITFSPLGTNNYGVAPFAAGASASSGLPITYTSSVPYVATVSTNGTITIVGVGETVITASQEGNANYLAAIDVDQTLVVQSVLSSVDGATVTLDFQDQDTTGYVSYANGWSTSDPVNRPDGYSPDSDPLKTNNILGFIGGAYSGPSATTTELTYNFNPGSSDRYVFQWNQNISSSVDFLGDDIFGWKFLSGADSAFSIQFLNDRGPFNDRDLLVQGYDGAGNALTLAAGQDNDWWIDRDDANDFRVVADLATKKWALDVLNKSNNSWFGLVANADIDPSFTSLDGFAATWTVASTNGVSEAGDNFMSFDNLTIQGKQTVTISLNLPTTPPIYNGQPHPVNPTTDPTGIPLIIKYNGSTNVPVNATTNPITVTAEVVDTTNYYSAPTSGVYTIDKASQTISLATPSEIRIYGDPSYNLGASTDSPLGLTYVSDNPAVATVDANGEVTIVGAGDAVITVSQIGDNNYEPAADVIQTLTVNRAAQAISGVAATAEPKTYGDPPYNLGASTDSPLGLTYVSDNPAVATVDANGEVTIVGAGVAFITVSQGGDGNYEPAMDMTHVLTVNKATQTISGVSSTLTKTYGDLSYNLSASTDSSLPLDFYSDTPNVATVDANGEVTIVGAGVATITVSQMGGDNHFPADVTHVLTVNRAAQAISGVAATQTKTYGDSSYNLNASTSSSLLLTYTSDTPTVATVDASGEVTIVGAGVVTITVSQIGGDNYEPATDVTHELTVNQAVQIITFPTLANGIVGRSTILTASGGGSGEPVTYTSSDPSVATVSGSTLSFVGAGSVTITASQAGNANYLAAGDQSQNFTVITAWDDWAGGFSLTNGTTRAKNADPDGDGFSNDLEFAFGTSPTNKNQEIFVSHGRVVGGGSTNYVVTFKKRIADVTYDIRSSTNLKLPFTNGTALAIGATNHVDANYVLTTVSLPMTNNRGFIRMKATVNTDPSP